MPATVHLAFGQHVNFYHSYRGDDPTSHDGFGIDIEVIGKTLDVLDRYPEVALDWDFDCFETLEIRLPQHAPGLLERIKTRLTGGDVVRHMGWAGEAASWCTDDEFIHSIDASRASIKEILGVDPVEAIYPQECMVTAEFPRLMTRAGLRWASLFYSATTFTAFRTDVKLGPKEQHNPLRYHTPDGEWSSLLVPMYHHADIVDHGSLKGWVDWVHNNVEAEDALVYICFDADAPTWPAVLEQGLAEVESLPYIRFTTASRYVDDNPPVGDLTLHKDLADGIFDGYGSWSEKPVNFEIFSEVVAARRREAIAEIYDPAGRTDFSARRGLFNEKLRVLATTNYGLAAPELHPDRVATARAAAAKLKEGSERIVADVKEGAQPKKGVIANVSAGEVLLDVGPVFEPGAKRRVVPVPKAMVGEGGLATEGASLALTVDGRPGALVLGGTQVAGGGWLRSGFMASGQLAEAQLVSEPGDGRYRFSGQFVWGAPVADRQDPAAGPPQIVAQPGTPAGGGIEIVASARGESPILRLDVTCDIPNVAGLLEVYPASVSPALAGWPLFVSRENFSGEVCTYEVNGARPSLNNHVTNGWMGVSDGSIGVMVAFDTTVLAGGACMPMRIDEFDGALAPLINPFGTFWGPQPDHHPEWSGGSGQGEQVALAAGEHVRPSGPAYLGKRLRFRLGLIGFHGATPGREAIAYARGFAHPPYSLG